ncbi:MULTISPECIES: hypothetical protein [unclassified Streptomyces]|nr:hypothetical protein OHB03_41735 [Streptomyces sp. NBC_01643]
MAALLSHSYRQLACGAEQLLVAAVALLEGSEVNMHRFYGLPVPDAPSP